MSTMIHGAEGRLRRPIAGLAVACLMLGLAGAARAGLTRATHRKPKLLYISPYSNRVALFARPKMMSFTPEKQDGFYDYLMGPGLTWSGYRDGEHPPIVWSRWGASAAGRATYWRVFANGCSACRDTRREVQIAAWRVRGGLYTRFSITWRSTVVYALRRAVAPASAGRLPGGRVTYRWCKARTPRSCTEP